MATDHDPLCERRAWHDPAEGTLCVYRERPCVESWRACESGAYNPSCCRWPKSCSVQEVVIPYGD